MTDILCDWLNEEVKLSKRVDPSNFAREFSTGYLIGEVLHKYDLQDDFNQFSQNKIANARLNNFTRLEPVLHLLEVPFDTNVARSIMTEQYGVATRLMYQVFVSLHRKVKANLTGVAMETMRPAGPVKLEAVESGIYKERLKMLTPRQTDQNLQSLKVRFQQKQIAMEKTAFKERFEEEERHMNTIQQQRQKLIQKHKESQSKKSEMLAKIQCETPSVAGTEYELTQLKLTNSRGQVLSDNGNVRAATVHIPKPPPSRTAKTVAMQQNQRKTREAEMMKYEVECLEEKMKRVVSAAKQIREPTEKEGVMALPDSIELIKPTSNDEYIGKIRKRLNEDASARAEREKRRRKVLVDQLKAHDAQEEARREEMLVNRLMRQSQQERRIAVQLLQARHEKEVIRRNRLMQEKQYEDRRLREFEDALNKEAEMAKLAKIEYAEQGQKDRELHDQIAADRAQQKYKKEYEMCLDVLLGIVDFSTKVGEYRELTNRLLPEKLMREWTQLFVAGQPLYESPPEVLASDDDPSPEKIMEQERQALLDENDFAEYRNIDGEWRPPPGCRASGPPPDNAIVGHIVQRLFDIVRPPTPPPSPPEFPPFPIKACVLGKVFSGKSSTVEKLAENHRLQVLNVDDLVAEAIEAHKIGELAEQNEHDELSDEEENLLPEKPPTATSEHATSGEKSSTVPDGSVEPDNRQLEEQAAAATAVSTERDEDPGAEKGDPEKPVEEDISSQSLSVDPMVTKPNRLVTPSSRSSSRPQSTPSTRPQASVRAKLGNKALRFLKRGKPVDDQLSIDIIVERIKRIPEDMGWILDGFPTTYQQGRLLEKALTGMETAAGGGKKSSKNQKSTLAPDPRPAPPPPEPGSGIDAVIYLDVPDELSLKRSAGRTQALQSEQLFQQEFNPPPEGSATGINKQEKVVPVDDQAHDQEQIQHRLTMFQDQWPKLEKWYTKFGSLHTVDGSQQAEPVYMEVEKVLEAILRRLQGKDVEESVPVEITETPEEPKPTEVEQPVEAAPEPKKEEDESRSRPTSRKGSRTGSAKRSGSRGSAKGDKSKSPSGGAGRAASKAESGKKSATGKASREERASSAKRGKSGKKGKSPEPEPEPEPEPPRTPLPEPGSDQWEFVDQAIAEEMAKILASQWEATESQYVNNSKVVFRNVRQERENIIRYFYQIRKDFQAYLRRPDHKQEFVASWQQEYNDLADDLRDDEETRAELHERVDDLRERLWTICDDRKLTAEGERGAVMQDGWLDDHIGLLMNHYITLYQGEVDRFQDTTRMLKDYYKAMEGKIPEEQAADFARIPLIELPTEVRPESAAHSIISGEGERATRPSTPADEVKSSASKSGTPSAKRKKVADHPPDDVPPADAVGEDTEKRTRIPLVPRRPLSPDAAAAQAAGKGSKQEKGGKGGKVSDNADLPPPPEDPDDRLLYDAFVTSITAIDKFTGKIAAEQAAREAEEEAERARELEKEKEKEKEKAAAAKAKGKGGKGGKKSRSPSPKKGKSSPTATTPLPSDEISEEEKEAKKILERARIEFFAALDQEASAAKTRLEVIRCVAMAVVADLRNKADVAYKDMDDWLGARFLKEMESIDHMSEVMRNGIETSSHVKEELVIDQEDFFIDEEVVMSQFEKDLKVLRTPSPVVRPPPVEPAYPDAFTVDQIMNLYQQFALTAPSGVLSTKAFQEMFSDLTALSHGTEQVPDIWMNVPAEKLESMSAQLSPDGEYIDWRTLILATAQPWPRPTQADLLNTLYRFSDMDQRNSGYVTQEQFDRVELWFSGPKPPSPANPMEPQTYDRIANLKTTFFDVFADHNSDPPKLDYVEMLQYFAVSADPYDGFLRALSVAARTHMPRLPHRTTLSRPASQASLDAFNDLEVVMATEEGFTEDIPEEAAQAKVPLDALDQVLHHGQSMRGDSHRFSVTADPEDAFSRDRLAAVYRDLGSESLQPVPLTALVEHPVIQDIVASLQTYKAVDLKAILLNPGPDTTDAHSIKTGE